MKLAECPGREAGSLKLGMAPHTWNLPPLGRMKQEDQGWLHGESEASLDYIRSLCVLRGGGFAGWGGLEGVGGGLGGVASK